jgi:hypothetical protein
MVLLTQPELEQEEETENNHHSNNHDDESAAAGVSDQGSKPVTIKTGLTAGAAIPPVHYGMRLANAAQVAEDMASTSHDPEAGHTNGDAGSHHHHAGGHSKRKGRKGLNGFITDRNGASSFQQAEESTHGHGHGQRSDSISIPLPSPRILLLKRNSTMPSPNQRNSEDDHHPPESSRKVRV